MNRALRALSVLRSSCLSAVFVACAAARSPTGRVQDAAVAPTVADMGPEEHVEQGDAHALEHLRERVAQGQTEALTSFAVQLQGSSTQLDMFGRIPERETIAGVQICGREGPDAVFVVQTSCGNLTAHVVHWNGAVWLPMAGTHVLQSNLVGNCSKVEWTCESHALSTNAIREYFIAFTVDPDSGDPPKGPFLAPYQLSRDQRLERMSEDLPFGFFAPSIRRRQPGEIQVVAESPPPRSLLVIAPVVANGSTLPTGRVARTYITRAHRIELLSEEPLPLQ